MCLGDASGSDMRQKILPAESGGDPWCAELLLPGDGRERRPAHDTPVVVSEATRVRERAIMSRRPGSRSLAIDSALA
jgi:hypothetical protein